MPAFHKSPRRCVRPSNCRRAAADDGTDGRAPDATEGRGERDRYTVHEFPTGKKDELAKLFRVGGGGGGGGVVGPFAHFVAVVIRIPDHRRPKSR